MYKTVLFQNAMFTAKTRIAQFHRSFLNLMRDQFVTLAWTIEIILTFLVTKDLCDVADCERGRYVKMSIDYQPRPQILTLISLFVLCVFEWFFNLCVHWLRVNGECMLKIKTDVETQTEWNFYIMFVVFNSISRIRRYHLRCQCLKYLYFDVDIFKHWVDLVFAHFTELSFILNNIMILFLLAVHW